MSVLLKDWIVKQSPSYAEVFHLAGEGFYIAYNPCPSIGGEEGAETALVWSTPWKCLILLGDWRSQYEAVIDQGYEACLAVYNKNKEKYRGSWSED